MIFTTLAAVALAFFQAVTSGYSFNLKNVEASRIVGDVKVLAGKNRSDIEFVTFDARFNSIIIRATEAGRKSVEDLLSKLDKAPPGAELCVFNVALENTSADEILPRLQRDRIAGVNYLSYDPAANSIFVRATSEAGRKVRDRILQLDQKKGAVLLVKRIKLATSSAVGAVTLIREAGIKGFDFLSHDPTDNSVIVRGNEESIKAIQALVEKYDKAEVFEVRKFTLAHSSATEALEKLKKEKIEGLNFLSADPTDNSIVARGTKAALEQIGKKIGEIDKV
jgi:type II secretory pathway component GspD/PulD (secretin)